MSSFLPLYKRPYFTTYNITGNIYSLLIENDICDHRNVSVKLPCVYMCLSSGNLFNFPVRVSSFFSYFYIVITICFILTGKRINYIEQTSLKWQCTAFYILIYNSLKSWFLLFSIISPEHFNIHNLERFFYTSEETILVAVIGGCILFLYTTLN